MAEVVEVNVKDIEIANNAVKLAQEMVKRGYQAKQIMPKVKKVLKKINLPFSAKDAYVAARIRLKARDKFGPLAEKLFFDESGYRYSTPSIIADYRAKRLKDYYVADVSCGAGMQLAFFGFRCKRAEGVEINKKRAFLAAMNIVSLNSNSTVYWGDAFKFETSAEVIFSDPARPESEKFRSFSTLQPNPINIMKKFEGKIFVFELPPQMPPERVTIKGEKEYTSLNFKLNRLALYTGNLSTCNVSAISLPSCERVTDLDERAKLEKGELKDLIAEVDRTVVHSNLLENLVGKLGLDAKIVYMDGRRTLLSVNELKNSAFLRYYRVLSIAKSFSECKEKLKEVGAKKVTLRFEIPPDKYWSVRKELEKELNGEKRVDLFKINEKFVICSKL